MDPDLSKTMSFDADRPIDRRDQDRLERRPFAESIASQIFAVPAEYGFTIGVAGPWGSGKTSVLNMVEETLDSRDKDVAILRFNPWLFSSPQELVSRFFSELGAQIGQNKSMNRQILAEHLAKLGQVLAPLVPVPGAAAIADQVVKAAEAWTKPDSLLIQREQLSNSLAKSPELSFSLMTLTALNTSRLGS